MDPLTALLLIIFLLTLGFAILIGRSSREDVRAHWSERRCDFDVMIAGFMYKPDEDKRTPFQFSADNFKFCISNMTTTYLQSVFGALFGILKTQMSASSVLQDAMGVMRAQLSNIYTPFSKMMNSFYNRFRQAGFLASRIFQHLYMSMKKAAGMSLAALFASLSLYTTIFNFIDFAIKVIMIVLGILLALAIIFFLPILPVLVIVIMTVGGIEAVYPGKTGSMGTVFCFAPDTKVVIKGGKTRRIQHLKTGDRLMGGQVVEAVVELANDGGKSMYMLDGVEVSGDHKVWSTDRNTWVFVKDHSSAIKVEKGSEVLWTLITSNREIPVQSDGGIQRFADWEEIPDTDEAAAVWEDIVCSILPTLFPDTPSEAPCFDGRLCVKKYQSGWVSITSIRLGDWIYGEKGWVKVIGVCKRRVDGAIGPVGSRMTDGVWLKKKGVWVHPEGKLEPGTWDGYTLVTSTGEFMLRTSTFETILVRDFTEVGWMNLPATYARVEKAM